MALSFKEKRELTKIVNAKVAEIQAGGLSFKEKRATTKALNDASAKLKDGLNIADPEQAGQNEKLIKLLEGGYNGLSPEEFLSKLREIVEEVGELDPTKPGIINYIKEKKGDAITESAESDESEDDESDSDDDGDDDSDDGGDDDDGEGDAGDDDGDEPDNGDDDEKDKDDKDD